jgi:IS5 family transposase
MLRIYFMQQWFSLSDPAMEDALYDIESMRRFAGIELGADPVPDEDHHPQLPSPAGEASSNREAV